MFSNKVLKVFPNKNVRQLFTVPSDFLVPKFRVQPDFKGFLVDERQNEREVVAEFQPSSSNKKVRIEIADNRDYAVLSEFWISNFIDNLGFLKRIDATFEEMAPLYFSFLMAMLGTNNCLIGVDESNKIVGTAIYSHYHREAFCEYQNDAKFEILKDYSPQIFDGPFRSLNANRVSAFLDAMIENMGKFVPPNLQRLGCLEALGVHPAYQKAGLGKMMIQTGDSLLKERAHCQGTVGYFLGSVGLKLAKKENYKIMFEFPFDKFLEGEVPIFANPEDKNDACYACLKIF